nr:odorant receptor [Semanotus bifasciatus]
MGVVIPCVGTDVLFMTLVTLMKRQFQLLSYSSKMLFSVTGEEQELRRRIKKWVDHHNYMLEPSSGDDFKYYSYMFALLIEFVAFYCLPAQGLTDEAEKISYNIWASRWTENSSPSVKTAMKMILTRSQKPVVIKAVIIDASYQTCLATFKSISSYYMFLQTISEDTY